jgi:hypothetical protein
MATLRSRQWWALAAALGVGCSINHAGLSDDGGPASTPGSGGTSGNADDGGGGGAAMGTGGDRGSGGAVASGGRVGSGGSGSGGASGTGGGTGGVLASGGISGSGGAGTGGAGSGGVGTGGLMAMGSGGAGIGGVVGTGSGGVTVGSGGTGTGGRMAIGSGGAGGPNGSGGAGSGGAGSGGAGSGGRAGTGGRMGTCDGYPNATAFALPEDSRIHCYWFRDELLTWPKARKQCMTEKGGDLVTITSAAENDVAHGVARFMGSFPQVWIGATDGRDKDDTMGPGTYRWVSNEPWGPYTNWNTSAPKQPDGYCDACDNDQPCTCDHRGTLAADGTWYDFWEENPRAYVCEAVPAAN